MGSLRLLNLVTTCNNVFRSHALVSNRLLKTPVSPVFVIRALSTAKTANPTEELVYEGALARQIKLVKVFSFTTSAMGLVMQPMLYEKLATADSVGLVAAAMGFVGFFTFATPFLLHFITKKYVIRMTHDPVKNEYSAVTLSFFAVPTKTKFTIEDVKVPEVPGMFTSIHAKGVPLFVDPKMFHDPEHYIKIMGYDKPIDFHLTLNESQKAAAQKNKT